MGRGASFASLTRVCHYKRGQLTQEKSAKDKSMSLRSVQWSRLMFVIDHYLLQHSDQICNWPGICRKRVSAVLRVVLDNTSLDFV